MIIPITIMLLVSSSLVTCHSHFSILGMHPLHFISPSFSYFAPLKCPRGTCPPPRYATDCPACLVADTKEKFGSNALFLIDIKSNVIQAGPYDTSIVSRTTHYIIHDILTELFKNSAF